MTILTVTAEGQVTLGKDVLKHLGIAPGDQIDYELRPNGTMVSRAAASKSARAPARSGSIENFIGMLASDNGPHLTIEEIKEITADGWASAMDYEKDDKS
jgi:bifunctional DNA-binding transcriptional regulator/antitoxin component of YhaV-PrlF toxin-antitoxin module